MSSKHSDDHDTLNIYVYISLIAHILEKYGKNEDEGGEIMQLRLAITASSVAKAVVNIAHFCSKKEETATALGIHLIADRVG